jgi:hypothetical protein
MKEVTIRFWVEDDQPDFKPEDSRAIKIDHVAAWLGTLNREQYNRVDLLTAEEIRKIGDGIAEREYYETVTGIVDDLKRAIHDGDVTDEDGAIEWLEQTIDGHHDVIYTSCAQDILRHSRNDGAYFDDFGDEGAVSDGGIEWSKLAYCALRADVLERINDLGDYFKCSDCSGDVDEDRIKAAALTDNYPQCADCAGDSDEDEDEGAGDE